MRLATGGKGKLFNDRELAAEVRTLALKQIKRALKGKYGDEEFKKAVILRLAGAILPRLNEVSGPNGKPIPISNIFVDNALQDHESNEEDSETAKEN